MLARYFRFIVLAMILAMPVIFSACDASDFPLIAIQVDPLCASVPPGGNQQFNATIFVNEVNQGVDNAAVTWSVLGGDVNGTVSDSGFYQAPNTLPPPANQVVVMATSKEDIQKSGQATVVLTGDCPVVPPPT